MPTIQELLLAMQGQTPARNRVAAPGMFLPPDPSPIAALLQSMRGQSNLGPAENTGALVPPTGMPPAGPRLPVAQPMPQLPAFIQLGPQPRPVPPPMLGGVDLPGMVMSMFQGNASPESVPAAVLPGQTPIGSGMFERAGP